MTAGWRGVMEEYRDLLPISEKTPVVTLLEGGTPLLPAPRLSERVGAHVWLKVEGANPTGSFKDRGMTMAISMAVDEGAKAVVCASTGNTSASAAAYASRAGLACVVLIPDGHIALGKLAQALMHGARVLQVRGNFDQLLTIVRDLPNHAPITVVNSVNPHRIEGQMTGAFEIVDVLGDAPDVHCIPVGNAGNISAYWRGYLKYKEAGRSTKLPQMMGFQAAGAAPIVLGHPVENPRRSPPPSASGTRPVGIRPRPPPPSPAVPSRRSPTTRSWTRTLFSPNRSPSSVRPRRPPRWPVCSSRACPKGPPWCVC